MNHKIILSFVLFAILLVNNNTSNASILVGTLVTPKSEQMSQVNDLITSYNANFNADLPTVTIFQDKLEDDGSANGAGFINGYYQVSDFTFYKQDDGGSLSASIFDDTSVNFSLSNMGTGGGFDSIDNPVQGFTQLSGTAVEYYVAKDGALGWSLWYAGSGFQPFYTDSAVNGFTYGSTSDTSLAYDPITSGVSHLSFYSSGANPSQVPEPASFIIWSVAGLSGVLCCRRRRVK